MKLRNKKTGEIKLAEAREDGIYLYDKTTEQWYKYELDLLATWWEYYEEPKEHWCITMYGGITRIKDDEEPIEDLIEIGNYFSSKEDAYDAWDKLRASKCLKDKGAEFYGWRRNQTGTYELYLRWKDRIPRSYEVKNDLDSLFSREGEE